MKWEDIFLGVLLLALAVLLVVRIVRSLRTDVIPLYRTRVSRAEIGSAKFRTIVALNGLVALGLFVLAADLFLGLGIRSR